MNEHVAASKAHVLDVVDQMAQRSGLIYERSRLMNGAWHAAGCPRRIHEPWITEGISYRIRDQGNLVPRLGKVSTASNPVLFGTLQQADLLPGHSVRMGLFSVQQLYSLPLRLSPLSTQTARRTRLIVQASGSCS